MADAARAEEGGKRTVSGSDANEELIANGDREHQEKQLEDEQEEHEEEQEEEMSPIVVHVVPPPTPPGCHIAPKLINIPDEIVFAGRELELSEEEKEGQGNAKVNGDKKRRPFLEPLQLRDMSQVTSLLLFAQDTLQDVRAALLEWAPAAVWTSFELRLFDPSGPTMPEFSQVEQLISGPEDGDAPAIAFEGFGFGNGAILHMVPIPYDARSVRAHIGHLRELLTNACGGIGGVGPAGRALEPSDDRRKLTSSLVASMDAKRATVTDQLSKEQAHRRDKIAARKGESGGGEFESVRVDIDRADIRTTIDAAEAVASLWVPRVVPTVAPCVESITFSAFNPPPNNRRLRGDLCYLEVSLLPDDVLSSVSADTNSAPVSKKAAKRTKQLRSVGRTLHITAWTGGFFLNMSNVRHGFDPRPIQTITNIPDWMDPSSGAAAAENISHLTLAGLLAKQSKVFEQRFPAVLGANFSRVPGEASITSGTPLVRPWCTPSDMIDNSRWNWPADASRAENAIIAATGTDVRNLASLPVRDWNEEWQIAREIPAKSFQEKLIRDRNIFRVRTEFFEHAASVIVSIVDTNVLPLNPQDPPDNHVWLQNGIFFSQPSPLVRDLKTRVDPAASATLSSWLQQSNDLRSVFRIENLEVEDLYTVLTAVVDYKGRRLVAQSVIPGILTRESTAEVLYGSSAPVSGTRPHEGLEDDPERLWLTATETFVKPMETVAKALLIKPVPILDDRGEVVSITVADVKGITGSDGRQYMLEANRTSPRDPRFVSDDSQDRGAADPARHLVLRPELLFRFARKRTETAAAESKTKVSDATESPDSTESPESPARVLFNVNVFCGYGPDPKDEAAVASWQEDEQLVRDAAEYLEKEAIPSAVNEWANTQAPLEGAALTTEMHRRGINLRDLGSLALCARKVAMEELASFPAEALALERVCVREMVVRAARHIFDRFIASTDEWRLATAVAEFLNAFVGSPEEVTSEHDAWYLPAQRNPVGHPTIDRTSLTSFTAASTDSSTETLTVRSLWAAIRRDLLTWYAFEAPSRASVADIVCATGTLRRIAIKIGIQVACRIYEFKQSSPTVFTPADVQCFFPMIKRNAYVSNDAFALLNTGREYLASGQFALATQLLHQAVQTAQSVVGFSDPLSARANKELALCILQSVLQESSDISLAGFEDADDLEDKPPSGPEGATKEAGNEAPETPETIMNEGHDSAEQVKDEKDDAVVAKSNTADVTLEARQARRNARILDMYRRWFEDLLSAVDFGKRSCLIFDQLKGPDDPDTFSAYEALMYVESHAQGFAQAIIKLTRNARVLTHQNGRTIVSSTLPERELEEELLVEAALLQHEAHAYARRCLDAVLITAGADQTTGIRFIVHLSSMLVDNQLPQQALELCSHALPIAASVYGKQSIIYGQLQHYVALAHASLQQFRPALAAEKEYFLILKALNDGSSEVEERMEECDQLLRAFTQRAVMLEKYGGVQGLKRAQIEGEAAAAAARGKSTGAVPRLAQGVVRVPAPAPEASIDEVLDYINDPSKAAPLSSGLGSRSAADNVEAVRRAATRRSAMARVRAHSRRR